VGQIVGKLREAVVELGKGLTIGQRLCSKLGVSDQAFYRSRGEYGGLKLDKGARLKKAGAGERSAEASVAEPTPDKLILKETAEEDF
jgi:hypothetical protein